MKDDTLTPARNDPPLAAAAIVALVGLATIGGFFFFEYGMGLPPCPLCLEQRNAYYVCVPLAALLWLGAGHGASRKVMMLGFIVIAPAMLWNTGLVRLSRRRRMEVLAGPASNAPGRSTVSARPATCSRAAKHSFPRCDEAAWRFLGISFAGYDVLVSLALARRGLGRRASLARRTIH